MMDITFKYSPGQTVRTPLGVEGEVVMIAYDGNENQYHVKIKNKAIWLKENELIERAKRVEGGKTPLKDILNEILDHQIANRGSEHAFYRCYTYKYGDFPEWVLKAEHMVRIHEGFTQSRKES